MSGGADTLVVLISSAVIARPFQMAVRATSIEKSIASESDPVQNNVSVDGSAMTLSKDSITRFMASLSSRAA